MTKGLLLPGFLWLLMSPYWNSAFGFHSPSTTTRLPRQQLPVQTPTIISSLLLPSCNFDHLLPLSSSKENNDNVDLAPHFTSPSVLAWLEKMAISYKLERGEELIDVILRESPVENNDDLHKNGDTPLLQIATICAQTPLAIASHDFLRDPSGEAIFIYGNMAFLTGFGYDWEEFVELPSKKCVETEGEVEERQKLLDAVKATALKSGGGNSEENGDADEDLAAKHDNLIRVRKDGGRILLKGVNLWNIYDVNADGDMESVRSAVEKGDIQSIGQAVWIKQVEYL